MKCAIPACRVPAMQTLTDGRVFLQRTPLSGAVVTTAMLSKDASTLQVPFALLALVACRGCTERGQERSREREVKRERERVCVCVCVCASEKQNGCVVDKRSFALWSSRETYIFKV